MDNLKEDELIEFILQEAWDKLLKAREDGKLVHFDVEVPAQIQSWLTDIYEQQIEAAQLTDQETYNNKLFSISMAYRISIKLTVGIDRFMKIMTDAGKMRAFDKLLADLESGIQKDNNAKRLLR